MLYMGEPSTLPLLVSLIGTKLSTISYQNAHGLYGPNYELGPNNHAAHDVEFFFYLRNLYLFILSSKYSK